MMNIIEMPESRNQTHRGGDTKSSLDDGAASSLQGYQDDNISVQEDPIKFQRLALEEVMI